MHNKSTQQSYNAPSPTARLIKITKALKKFLQRLNLLFHASWSLKFKKKKKKKKGPIFMTHTQCSKMSKQLSQKKSQTPNT